ncbi:MAG: orotidine-5'-phosphate decarboxylase [Verrucomicrobia bacterium]|nr:MAG: orotidine-5'-phosphate decarboxylase [Verrucomicrobiota bacterium]
MHQSKKAKIIVALDVDSATEALLLVKSLAAEADAFKVGLQLFTREGPDIIRKLKMGGAARIFLDLKFHDIPNTVAQAVSAAASLGVDLLTVHLSGGPEMLKAAAQAAQRSALVLLGVSVLTSSDVSTLNAVGIHCSVEDQVLRLADLAVKYLGGIVASPKEISALRKQVGESLQIVTPGVRPAWAAQNDQKRILTPLEASELGADWLVIGRPITGASFPLEALQKIKIELQETLNP